jgi:HSP20 family molecular chaperone IbpA
MFNSRYDDACKALALTPISFYIKGAATKQSALDSLTSHSPQISSCTDFSQAQCNAEFSISSDLNNVLEQGSKFRQAEGFGGTSGNFQISSTTAQWNGDTTGHQGLTIGGQNTFDSVYIGDCPPTPYWDWYGNWWRPYITDIHYHYWDNPTYPANMDLKKANEILEEIKKILEKIPNKIEKELNDSDVPTNQCVLADGSLLFELALAGFDEADVMDVSFRDNYLLVEWNKITARPATDLSYMQHGIKTSKGKAKFFVDEEKFEWEQITSEYNNGILCITVPIKKTDHKYTKKIVVKRKTEKPAMPLSTNEHWALKKEDEQTVWVAHNDGKVKIEI